MTSMVREKICNKIWEAEVYSVLADETKDYSKKEHLSIVLRYTDTESAIQYKYFISTQTSCNGHVCSIQYYWWPNKLTLTGMATAIFHCTTE